MKKPIIILLLCLLSSFLYAQNPYESIGKKEKVIGLSGGKYTEFFKNKDVVQIGTTIINIKTGKIISSIPTDSTYQMPKADVSGRFLAVDPLAEKYYDISPYAYVMNNPIKYIDPDGRVVVDANGNVVMTQKSDFVWEGTAESHSTTVDGITTITFTNYTFQKYNIYADDGTAIEVDLVLSSEQVTQVINDQTGEFTQTIAEVDPAKVDCYTNCHGLTFAGGNLRMGDDQAEILLKADGYINTDKSNADAVAFYPTHDSNETNHSAKRNPDGTYNSNNGDEITLYNTDLQKARRGRNVDPKKDRFVKKSKPNRILNTNLGTVNNNGQRVINDQKQIATFLKQLNGNK